MYQVSNEVYNNILEEVENVLDDRNYNYQLSALAEILDTWLIRKTNLLNLLSKHPNWDADRLMIKFDQDFSRKIDTTVSAHFMNWLYYNTTIDSIVTKMEMEWYGRTTLYNLVYWTLTDNTYLQDDENTVEYINKINALSESFNFRPGMKVTKVMRKICAHYGWDNKMETETNPITGEVRTYNAFEREYAKYCDAMCPIKVKRHTCISLNPVDFLLMSYGNSWRSCHDINWADDNPGEYSSGTISYMLDEHTFVFYTVDAAFNGEYIEQEAKMQRQIFAYHNNRLLQSRLYPQSNDSGAKEVYTDIRNIVQKVIADCCDKPNLWVKRNVYDVSAGAGSTCYPDWSCSSSLCSVSVFNDCAKETGLGFIEMGAQPICIYCGNSHDYSGNIDCCNGRYVCEACGGHIDEDSVHWVGDYCYCEDCVTYCDECQEWEINDRTTYVESTDRYVCDYCLQSYYSRCPHCGDYFRNDEMRYVDSEGEDVCEDCLEEYYSCCEKCGEWYRKDKMEEVDDRYYCEDCYEELQEEEEE